MHPLIKLQLQIQNNNEIQKIIAICMSQIIISLPPICPHIAYLEFPPKSILSHDD